MILNSFLFVTSFLVSRVFLEINGHIFFTEWLLKKVKKHPLLLLVLILFISCFLSSFIPNAITILALLPLIEAMLEQIEFQNEKQKNYYQSILVLATIYGANIGGVSSLIGSPANLLLLGFLEYHHIPSREAINFFSWFLFGIPLAFFFVLLAIAVFYLFERNNLKKIEMIHHSIQETPQHKKFTLGIIICIFNLIFFFFLSAINYYFPKQFIYYIDIIVVFYSTLLIGYLFIIPFSLKLSFKSMLSNTIINFSLFLMFPIIFIIETLKEICLRFRNESDSLLYQRIESFNHFLFEKITPGWVFKKDERVHQLEPTSFLSSKKIIYSLPFLGLAVAFFATFFVLGIMMIGDDPTTSTIDGYLSNLVLKIANLAFNINHNALPALMLIVLAGIFATEFMSNTTVAILLFPVSYQLALKYGIEPIIILIGVSFASTAAFMSPVATAVNAIGFASLKGNSFKIMLKLGFVLNIIGSVLMSVFLYFVVSKILF